VAYTFNLHHAALNGLDFSELIFLNITVVSVFLTAINLSFYAVFLIRYWEGSIAKLSFQSFFGTLQLGDWFNYLVFAFGGSLLYLTCFHYFAFSASIPNSPDSMAQLIGVPGLDRMFSNFMLLLLDYLPGFLGVCVIYFHLKRCKSLQLSSKEFIMTLLSIAIIGTILFVFSSRVIAFMQFYLGGIISLPFVEPLIPSLIMFFLYLFVLSVFYPALASCFAAPFVYFLNTKKVEKPINNKDLLNE
jgi:hypothetical protein